MKRWLMLGCALALFAGPAMATVPGVTTGTLINVNDAIQAPLAGQASSVGLSVTADTNVTLVVEGSVDGSTWSTLTGTVVGGTSTATSFSSSGQWTFNTGGLASVRARAAVSGATPTATVLLLGTLSIAGLSSNGGGTTTANQGTPNAGGVNAWPVAIAAPANFTPAQVSVASTATLIAAQRTTRQLISIVNTTTTAIYIGGSGVTTTTGQLLPGVVGASITVPTTAALYGIVATGTATVTEAETY